MDRTKCRYHGKEDVDIWCVQCKTLICHVCQEEEHDDHDLKELSSVAQETRKKLASAHGEIETCLKEINKLMDKAQAEIKDFEKSLTNAQEIMDMKVEAIIKWAKDMRQNANTRFEFLKQEGTRELKKPVRELRKKLDDFSSQSEEVQTALDASQSDQYAVRFYEQYKTQRPKIYPTFDVLKNALKKYSVRVVMNGDTQETCRTAIEAYLGIPVSIQMSPETDRMSSMCLVPQFSVSEDEGCIVTAILPLQDSVCVAVQNPMEAAKQSASHLSIFTKTGKKVKEEQIFETSHLKMTHHSSDKLLVYSPKTHTRKMIALGQNLDNYTSSPKHQYVLVKADHDSYNLCETHFMAGSHEPPTPVSKIPVSNPVSLAVSRDGQYFAIIQESKEIIVCRRGVHEAIVKVKSAKKKGHPTDICFHTLDKKEVLLIADAKWNQISVVDFLNPVKCAISQLTLDCSLLTSPTALATDSTGRVWIGCKGGQVLTCVPTETMLLEHPKLQTEEDSGGYLVPEQIAAIYREIERRQRIGSAPEVASGGAAETKDDSDQEDKETTFRQSFSMPSGSEDVLLPMPLSPDAKKRHVFPRLTKTLNFKRKQ